MKIQTWIYFFYLKSQDKNVPRLPLFSKIHLYLYFISFCEGTSFIYWYIMTNRREYIVCFFQIVILLERCCFRKFCVFFEAFFQSCCIMLWLLQHVVVALLESANNNCATISSVPDPESVPWSCRAARVISSINCCSKSLRESPSILVIGTLIFFNRPSLN